MMTSKFLDLRAVIVAFVAFMAMSMAAGTPVKGVVYDSSGEPVIGATVREKGAKDGGTATNADGQFDLQVSSSNATLVVSYVGMATQDVRLGGNTNVSVTMKNSDVNLDELVVVGYGTMKKSDLTGSLSQVKGKELNMMSTANVQTALAGRAAGVQVVSSGSVDGPVKVRIRGVGTINNSDPLYVVDGFPTSDISYIAPEDIESMEVLKDASASAIYGSRGANGVIMITTKKGLNVPTQVSANIYAGFSNASKKLDVLNAADYARARMEAYTNAGASIDTNEKAMLQYAIDNNSTGTDWQDELLRTGSVQNYNVSVIGGSDKSKYNLSATYNSTDGALKNSYVDKLFLKFNNEYKFSRIVTGGVDIAYVNYRMSNTDISNMYGSALSLASRAAPISPVYTQFGDNWAENMSLDYNCVRLNEMEKYKKKTGNEFIGNFFLNFDLYKGLSFRSTFGVNFNNSKYKNYLPVYSVSAQEHNTQSTLEESRYNNYSWVWSNVLNYNWNIDANNTLNSMIGTEATYENYETLYAKAYDVMENEDMRYISAAKSNSYVANSSQSKSTIFSAFVRLNYAFMNKYLLTGTLRSDASSRFAKGNRVGYFPSVSAGWDIKKENFLKDTDWLSQMKIRAGWGQVGNQSSAGIGDYLSKITNGLKYVLGGKVYEGRVPTGLSNPELKWEKAEQYNVGLDAGILNQKLTLSADYFVKKTKDMIVSVPVPDYVGATGPLANVGTMRNKGFEFTITHRNTVSDFDYSMSLNMSFIKNKVLSLGRAGAMDQSAFDRLSITNRTEVGREIAYFYGFKTDGVFHTQDELDAYKFTNADGSKTAIQPNAQVGDVKYQDLNGNGKIDAGDMTYLGSYIPDFTGGFNLTGAYKGFDLSLFFDFSYGGKIANINTYELRSSQVNKNILKDYYNGRWTADNPGNNAPRLTNGGIYKENNQFSDRYVEDGSYLRIRNLQIGYSLPKALIQKAHIDKARLYVSVDNLATITGYTGYNPEISDQWSNVLVSGCDIGGAPLYRTFTFGLNLNF